MSYSASELLNVFGFYLDHGMAEAVRVHPWHRDFLLERKDKTIDEVEIELLSPKKATTAVTIAAIREYRRKRALRKSERYLASKRPSKHKFIRRVVAKRVKTVVGIKALK